MLLLTTSPAPPTVQEAAQEVAQAPSAPAKISKMGALLRALDSGPLAAWLARALICSYYVNMAYAGWESYRVLQDHGARAGLRRWGADRGAGVAGGLAAVPQHLVTD